MSAGKNYRATKKNFLPPPRKTIITKSDKKYTDGTNYWLFDKDIPEDERSKRFKNWALFTSDQWDSRSLIAYVNFEKQNESTLPGLGERFILFRGEEHYNFVVINRFITKKICRTYVLRTVK